MNGKVSTLTIRTIQETYERVIKGGPDPDCPGQIAPMATGGAVVGRGQKGIDSELRLLAPGEHVLPDSDVDAMGGQGGVYEFRKQLHSGAGPMGYQYAPAAAPARSVAAVPAVASGPTQMTGTLIMDSGQVFGTFRGVAVEVATSPSRPRILLHSMQGPVEASPKEAGRPSQRASCPSDQPEALKSRQGPNETYDKEAPILPCVGKRRNKWLA
ncbi:hypothetical protein StoSoilB22_07620 [Arthrobacter sp. StoSoilB22]|nr:hypothetical protein StoSoilB22_07620 [Arthrobacter sp. StoSoilB22]